MFDVCPDDAQRDELGLLPPDRHGGRAVTDIDPAALRAYLADRGQAVVSCEYLAAATADREAAQGLRRQLDATNTALVAELAHRARLVDAAANLLRVVKDYPDTTGDLAAARTRVCLLIPGISPVP